MPASLNGRAVAAAVLLAVLAGYANALLWGVFQFDDYNVIVGNPAVQSWPAWREQLGNGIRPLLKASYTLDWVLGGGAAGFHFTNLLIHAGNSLLVWRLTSIFLSRTALPADVAWRASAATALLFALHPVHSEAVSYISGRSSSLMTLCYLAGLYCHLLGQQRRSALLLHGATPLLFLVALAVKEVAITFPLALLLLHRAAGGRWRTAWTDGWSSWLLAGAAALSLLLQSAYQTHLLHSLESHVGWSNLVLQGYALLYLLGQWCWPLQLNIDPDLGSVAAQAAALRGLLALLLAGLCWMLRRGRRPWLGFALGWLLLQLLLVYLGAPRLDIANERQLYLASWPLLMALATELAQLLDARRYAMLCTALLLAGGILTVQRNRDYASELALWQATARLSPDKSRVHNNLGYAYALVARPDEARRHYRRALELDAGNFRAGYNLRGLEAARQPPGR